MMKIKSSKILMISVLMSVLGCYLVYTLIINFFYLKGYYSYFVIWPFNSVVDSNINSIIPRVIIFSILMGIVIGEFFLLVRNSIMRFCFIGAIGSFMFCTVWSNAMFVKNSAMDFLCWPINSLADSNYSTVMPMVIALGAGIGMIVKLIFIFARFVTSRFRNKVTY